VKREVNFNYNTNNEREGLNLADNSHLEELQKTIVQRGLELFIVSHEESIQYLTGVSYRPLERPLFILIHPAKKPDLLVPVMERDHLTQAGGIGTIYTYCDYPAVDGQQWNGCFA
jgi:Xaa-Pro aminopeptidase